MLLGVNIDHVATLRQQRLGSYPSPIDAALMVESAGADSITMHLREDRRHILDADVYCFQQLIQTHINLECAITPEMLAIACQVRPRDVCLVPERREELTTEGGLDVCGRLEQVKAAVVQLQDAGIRVSLFIDPEEAQLEAAVACGAPVVELHTGAYAQAAELLMPNTACQGLYPEVQAWQQRVLAEQQGALNTSQLAPAAYQAEPAPLQQAAQQSALDQEIARLQHAARTGVCLGLQVNAGHGLHYGNLAPILAMEELTELNIGHAIVARAVFVGLSQAVAEMKALMQGALPVHSR